jgi:hypothetical protein
MKIINYFFAYVLGSIALPIMCTTPTIGFNFTSVDVINAVAGTIGIPQNPTADGGPTQYIVSSYPAMRSFDKLTTEPDRALNIDANSFAFSGGDDSTADVWLLYDRFAQRWFFSCENATTSALHFVVSDSAIITPQTQWAFYEVPLSTLNPAAAGVDYNQPAYDQNAWYNGLGTFDGSGHFLGSTLTVVSQSSILAGNPNITVFPGLFPEVVNIVQEGFACPATNFDANPEFGYFLWLIYDTPNSISGTRIQFYRILDAGSNTPTLGPLVTITVPEFAFNGLLSPHKGNLFGAVGLLQNLLGHFGAYPTVRNKQLYLCHDIQVDSSGTASTSGDRVGIRWYQFDMTGDSTGQGLGTETPSTVPVLIQTGTLFDTSATNPLFYFNSSMMTNKNGDLCISFSASGNDAYINAGYAFRSGSDPLNTLQSPVLVTNSSFPYNYCPNNPLNPGPNCQRWGDASIVVTDPSDDTTFWLTQPWAALQNAWGIQTTQVIPTAA